VLLDSKDYRELMEPREYPVLLAPQAPPVLRDRGVSVVVMAIGVGQESLGPPGPQGPLGPTVLQGS
jgi:hypothetical protein